MRFQIVHQRLNLLTYLLGFLLTFLLTYLLTYLVSYLLSYRLTCLQFSVGLYTISTVDRPVYDVHGRHLLWSNGGKSSRAMWNVATYNHPPISAQQSEKSPACLPKYRLRTHTIKRPPKQKRIVCSCGWQLEILTGLLCCSRGQVLELTTFQHHFDDFSDSFRS